MTQPRRSRSPVPWRDAILDYIEKHPGRPPKPRALARTLGVSDADYSAFRQSVRTLLDDGAVQLGRGRTLTLPRMAQANVGTFRANRRGFGFVQRRGGADLYVARHALAGARDGDTVAFRLVRGRRGDPLDRAEIVRVIKRGTTQVVGVLERAGKRWLVQPQGKSPLPSVQIDDPTAKAARDGDVVVVELLDAADKGPLKGVILERLGAPADARTKIQGIIRRFEIPHVFPDVVAQEARAAERKFNPDDLGDRLDLRDTFTLTIDPVDARDFDDAISIQPLSGGRTQLGVHIADVAHFVPPGSALDAEAYERGNSVYFPGYVVPMLPEALSNGVCSLQPGEPRYCKSVFIDYDPDGRVVGTRFANSLIQSSCRLSYEEATAILEQREEIRPADAPVAAQAVTSLLRQADSLARRIRARRLRDGMIVLALPEVAIRLDDRGRVVDAGPADNSFSHTIIEMFMVEANEAVARFLTELGLPHLRRVHAGPTDEDGTLLRQLGPLLGRRPPSTLNRKEILGVLREIEGLPVARVVQTLLLRSMAQARYSPADEGHFALASEDYCHFTSPIRRYPDLVVHRLLDRMLRGEQPAQDYLESEVTQTDGEADGPRSGKRRIAPADANRPSRRKPRGSTAQRKGGRRAPGRDEEVVTVERLTQIGQHTSATERRAQTAERELRHMLLVEFMNTKLGEFVEVIITGIGRFGAYVQIQPYLADAVLGAGDFGPGAWEFDERQNVFRARGSRRTISIGQTFRARVASVDTIRHEVRVVPQSRIGAAGS